MEGHTAASKYQSVSASSEHLVFGVGRNKCPGRLFALEEGQSVPQGYYIAGGRTPSIANVMFRARKND
ncbi:hypothetical protein BGY98DRAFT_1001165, partial [Russula aff. rugulosa BPL654]